MEKKKKKFLQMYASVHFLNVFEMFGLQVMGSDFIRSECTDLV